MNHRGQVPSLLITGANGFVGRHLQRAVSDRLIAYRAVVRRGSSADAISQVIDDIGPMTDWNGALEGIKVVIHLAARAHVLKEVAKDPRGQFMRVNAEGTARLVGAAVSAGVKRFIYMSSVGVLGRSSGETTFRSGSIAQPHNFYTESKLAGEQAARSMASEGLEVVILRPPLVYGPEVGANFLRLLRWVDKGLPLPLGAVRNRRSLVNVWNLCDLVLTLIESPSATKCNWLVSDGEDLSSPELIGRIASHMGRRTRLLAVPQTFLRLAAGMVGYGSQLEQLCGSLTVDISDTMSVLGWSPVVALEEGLSRTVEWYRSMTTAVSRGNSSVTLRSS